MTQGLRTPAGRGAAALAAFGMAAASLGSAVPARGERAGDEAAHRRLPVVAEQTAYRAEAGPSSREVVTDGTERLASLDAVEDAAHEIAAVARTLLAANLGGVYIDHATGKTVVLLTGDVRAHLAALRSRVAHPDLVAGKPARFTLDDLTRAGDTIMARHAAYGVTATSVDERNNTLDVLLAEDTASARAGVLGLLRPHEARMVRFQESAPAETLWQPSAPRT